MTPIVILMTVGVVAAVSGWNNKRKSRGEESERAARLLFPRPPLILRMAMQIIQKWSKCPNLWENCEKLWSWSILSIVLSQIGISPPIGGLQSNYKFKWFCWSLLFRKVYPSYLFCGAVAQVLKTSRRVSLSVSLSLYQSMCLWAEQRLLIWATTSHFFLRTPANLLLTPALDAGRAKSK